MKANNSITPLRNANLHSGRDMTVRYRSIAGVGWSRRGCVPSPYFDLNINTQRNSWRNVGQFYGRVHEIDIYFALIYREKNPLEMLPNLHY